MLDDGTGALATYVVYSATGAPLRALVYNSDYFDGTGTRGVANATLSGLAGAAVRALRLTAPNAASRVDQGGVVTIGGGQTFANDCGTAGAQVFETVAVSNGTATVSVQASEALIVYL